MNDRHLASAVSARGAGHLSVRAQAVNPNKESQDGPNPGRWKDRIHHRLGLPQTERPIPSSKLSGKGPDFCSPLTPVTPSLQEHCR